MLVITRKIQEKFVIGDEIEIFVLNVSQNRVQFGIRAPKHIKIQTHLKSSSATPSGEIVDEIKVRELKSTRSAV
jgi:sRNA-binding carbon storage regulator CsrA